MRSTFYFADDGSLEVLDFKAQKRPPDTDGIVRTYYQQLCVYAHILEQRRGRQPDRLLLYWTGESTRAGGANDLRLPTRRRAPMRSPTSTPSSWRCKPSTSTFCDAPPRTVCKECDFRSYCVSLGTIDAKATA